MNFSRFEYLKDQDRHLAECIKCCVQAERNVRINPQSAAISARMAVDELFKKLSRDNNEKPANLSASICLNCAHLKKNSEAVQEKADRIRRKGNAAVHPREIEEVEAATQKNISQAMDIVKDLYALLCLLYDEPGHPDFREDDVPFGDYYIEREVKFPEEYNCESYFVYSAGRRKRYYYLQCFSFGAELLLQDRLEEADDLFYNSNFGGDSHLRLRNTEISLPENSDLKLIVYSVGPESKLLSEYEKSMSLADALQVMMDLIEALEDLKSLGINHRNIFPGSVLIEKDRRGHPRAYLMNLQTSKIIDSTYTVNALLAARHSLNLYLPVIPQNETPDWEKVDVYALCRLFLYCLHPHLALATTTEGFDEYLDYELPSSIRRLYRKLFLYGSDLERLPTLSEVKEIFECEYQDA